MNGPLSVLGECFWHLSRISVVTMAGAVITIDNAAAADTIQSVKKRIFAANRDMPMRRQRLVYRPGPHGLEALADDETLGGVGVAHDGSSELDLLLEPLTEDEIEELGTKVLIFLTTIFNILTTAVVATMQNL
jgi:hypothetical protein